MTNGFVTASSANWKLALQEYSTAKAAWGAQSDQPALSDPDPLLERYILAEHHLLTEPAPDFEAVINKLYIIWADEIEIVTPDSYPLLSIIGDVRRLSSTESEV